uniref:U66-Liphistoxin-Lth1a_1 n=2 Tax=Liphistius TaxID=62150 RepID=A0A4Q8K2A1_9ARAC
MVREANGIPLVLCLLRGIQASCLVDCSAHFAADILRECQYPGMVEEDKQDQMAPLVVGSLEGCRDQDTMDECLKDRMAVLDPDSLIELDNCGTQDDDR